MMKNLIKPTTILRKKIFSSVLFAAFIVAFVASCSKFEEAIDFNRIADPEWNPDLAMPLINSNLILQDFFPDSATEFFRINEDSSISLIYDGKQLFSASAEELIKIPDQEHNIPADIVLPSVPIGLIDSLDIPLRFQVITDTTGQRIDSLMLKSGTLVLGGNCNLNKENVMLRVIFPGLLKKSNGENLILNYDLSNPGVQQQEINFTQTIDFAQYKMVFDSQSATEPNMINFILRFVITGDQNPNLPSYSFEFNYSMTDIKFSSIYGYFGNLEFGFNDSIQITVFDKNIAGGIDVGQEAINIVVDIANSMGLPIKFNATDVWFHSPVNDPFYTDILLFGPGIENNFLINSPDISQLGQIARTHLDFHENNIEEAFKIAPTLFYYNFECVTNPENNPGTTNFLLDDSRLSLDVFVQFDLFAAMRKYVFQDTVDFDLDAEQQEVDRLLFRLNITNGFPINGNMQIYFTDSLYTMIDSLIYDNETTIIEGAPIGDPPLYKVTEPANEITDIYVDTERFNKVKKAKKMLLRTELSTTNEQFVKLYTGYSMGIKVGIIAGLNINSNN